MQILANHLNFMESLLIPEQAKIIGEYTLRKVEERYIPLILAEYLQVPIGHLTDRNGLLRQEYESIVPTIIMNYHGELERFIKTSQYKNLVPNILRYALATLISGTTVVPTFKSNYVALGSNGTAAANTDTALGTEAIRGAWTNRYAIDNVAYLDKYFSSTEVGGNTYLEIGSIVDGTASANTGYLLSHANINETMAATETLSINATFTIT
jgi:hypothetical protein